MEIISDKSKMVWFEQKSNEFGNVEQNVGWWNAADTVFELAEYVRNNVLSTVLLFIDDVDVEDPNKEYSFDEVIDILNDADVKPIVSTSMKKIEKLVASSLKAKSVSKLNNIYFEIQKLLEKCSITIRIYFFDSPVDARCLLEAHTGEEYNEYDVQRMFEEDVML